MEAAVQVVGVRHQLLSRVWASTEICFPPAIWLAPKAVFFILITDHSDEADYSKLINIQSLIGPSVSWNA